jgi:hypothetical protein
MPDVAFPLQRAPANVLATQRHARVATTAATMRKPMPASYLTAFDTHFWAFYDRTDRRSMD